MGDRKRLDDDLIQVVKYGKEETLPPAKPSDKAKLRYSVDVQKLVVAHEGENHVVGVKDPVSARSFDSGLVVTDVYLSGLLTETVYTTAWRETSGWWLASGWVSGASGPQYVSGWELVYGWEEYDVPIQREVEAARINIDSTDIRNSLEPQKSTDFIDISATGDLLLSLDLENQHLNFSSEIIDGKLQRETEERISGDEWLNDFGWTQINFTIYENPDDPRSIRTLTQFKHSRTHEETQYSGIIGVDDILNFDIYGDQESPEIRVGAYTFSGKIFDDHMSGEAYMDAKKIDKAFGWIQKNFEINPNPEDAKSITTLTVYQNAVDDEVRKYSGVIGTDEILDFDFTGTQDAPEIRVGAYTLSGKVFDDHVSGETYMDAKKIDKAFGWIQKNFTITPNDEKSIKTLTQYKNAVDNEETEYSGIIAVSPSMDLEFAGSQESPELTIGIESFSGRVDDDITASQEYLDEKKIDKAFGWIQKNFTIKPYGASGIETLTEYEDARDGTKTSYSGFINIDEKLDFDWEGSSQESPVITIGVSTLSGKIDADITALKDYTDTNKIDKSFGWIQQNFEIDQIPNQSGISTHTVYKNPANDQVDEYRGEIRVDNNLDFTFGGTQAAPVITIGATGLSGRVFADHMSGEAYLDAKKIDKTFGPIQQNFTITKPEDEKGIDTLTQYKDPADNSTSEYRGKIRVDEHLDFEWTGGQAAPVINLGIDTFSGKVDDDIEALKDYTDTNKIDKDFGWIQQNFEIAKNTADLTGKSITTKTVYKNPADDQVDEYNGVVGVSEHLDFIFGGTQAAPILTIGVETLSGDIAAEIENLEQTKIGKDFGQIQQNFTIQENATHDGIKTLTQYKDPADDSTSEYHGEIKVDNNLDFTFGGTQAAPEITIGIDSFSGKVDADIEALKDYVDENKIDKDFGSIQQNFTIQENATHDGITTLTEYKDPKTGTTSHYDGEIKVDETLDFEFAGSQEQPVITLSAKTLSGDIADEIENLDDKKIDKSFGWIQKNFTIKPFGTSGIETLTQYENAQNGDTTEYSGFISVDEDLDFNFGGTQESPEITIGIGTFSGKLQEQLDQKLDGNFGWIQQNFTITPTDDGKGIETLTEYKNSVTGETTHYDGTIKVDETLDFNFGGTQAAPEIVVSAQRLSGDIAAEIDKKLDKDFGWIQQNFEINPNAEDPTGKSISTLTVYKNSDTGEVDKYSGIVGVDEHLDFTFGGTQDAPILTIGANTFSGKIVDDLAKKLDKDFGWVQRNFTIEENDTGNGIKTLTQYKNTDTGEETSYNGLINVDETLDFEFAGSQEQPVITISAETLKTNLETEIAKKLDKDFGWIQKNFTIDENPDDAKSIKTTTEYENAQNGDTTSYSGIIGVSEDLDFYYNKVKEQPVIKIGIETFSGKVDDDIKALSDELNDSIDDLETRKLDKSFGWVQQNFTINEIASGIKTTTQYKNTDTGNETEYSGFIRVDETLDFEFAGSQESPEITLSANTLKTNLETEIAKKLDKNFGWVQRNFTIDENDTGDGIKTTTEYKNTDTGEETLYSGIIKVDSNLEFDYNGSKEAPIITIGASGLAQSIEDLENNKLDKSFGWIQKNFTIEQNGLSGIKTLTQYKNADSEEETEYSGFISVAEGLEFKFEGNQESPEITISAKTLSDKVAAAESEIEDLKSNKLDKDFGWVQQNFTIEQNGLSGIKTLTQYKNTDTGEETEYSGFINAGEGLDFEFAGDQASPIITISASTLSGSIENKIDKSFGQIQQNFTIIPYISPEGLSGIKTLTQYKDPADNSTSEYSGFITVSDGLEFDSNLSQESPIINIGAGTISGRIEAEIEKRIELMVTLKSRLVDGKDILEDRKNQLLIPFINPAPDPALAPLYGVLYTAFSGLFDIVDETLTAQIQVIDEQ